jgi:hypothetical protein
MGEEEMRRTLARVAHEILERNRGSDDLVLVGIHMLAPLGANLVRVWGFDSGKKAFQLHDSAAPRLSDLTTLVRGRGYWIMVKRAQAVTLGGGAFTLSAGWHLIGWLG